MSSDHILTLNAGSSSLKYALFQRREVVASVGATSGPGHGPFGAAGAHARILSGTLEVVGGEPADQSRALDTVLARLESNGGLRSVAGVGNRVVHGGDAFESATLVTPEVLAKLRGLSELDPDHLPAEIAILEALRAREASLPLVACFDTTFHKTMPRVARQLAIPRRYEALGIRRYGFHGLSYQFLSEELARLGGTQAASGRVIMAHLGSGASLAAMRDGQCLDTTMGFTPNSGVAMGTRSGDLEPGAVLRMMRLGRLGPDAIDETLNHGSGLLGISETTSDMRKLLAEEATDARAAEAVALFCYQVRKAIGSLAAVLGGLDMLVFSGGIGENASAVRARVASGLEHLGVRLDSERNEAAAPIVSSDASDCLVRIIHTDEEAIIARDTVRVVSARESAA
jgi:acetate kinase